MKNQFRMAKMIAAAFVSILFVSCESDDENIGKSSGTVPRAVGPWQRQITEDFNNLNNWSKTSRYDYNSKYCLYDAAVPKIANYDGRNVLVLTATKSGSIWKSGHVKSNYSFKPAVNTEYRVSAQIKLIAMNGTNYVGFASTYGAWPAFWTVQETGWPTKGEIDIMEGYSYGGSASFASNLFYGYNACSTCNLLGRTCEKQYPYNVSNDWHLYDEYWKNENGWVTVTIKIDHNTVFSYTNSINGNLRLQNFGPHNIILNLNVGDNGDIFTDSRINLFSKTMMWVDYVTVDKRTL